MFVLLDMHVLKELWSREYGNSACMGLRCDSEDFVNTINMLLDVILTAFKCFPFFTCGNNWIVTYTRAALDSCHCSTHYDLARP